MKTPNRYGQQSDGVGNVKFDIPRVSKDVVGLNHHVALHTLYQPRSGQEAKGGDSCFAPSPRQQQLPNPVVRRRASNACNHCRARRRRCENDNGRTPCRACIKHGEESGCYFYAKGEQSNDREVRKPRQRGSSTANAEGSARARRSALGNRDPWADLPPLEEMIDGVQQFLRHYFQLGFIPKERYLETLRNDHRSVNVFLLLSILSVSARLSPQLRARYGDGLTASQFFMDRAQRIAEKEVYAEPLLERCQAYYVLSMAQEAHDLGKHSRTNMGIAICIATDMELHVESSYQIQDPTPERIIRAESARRTLWMLHSQDKLHSGPRSVESLAASDITALLPCDEADFAAGREPRFRAALSATASGAEHPEIVYHPESSLFASLMEAHLLWGSCLRRGYASYAWSNVSWNADDGESEIMRRLRRWEQSLPREHTFSRAMLQHHKALGQDLAYLGVTMIVRLCNIVLRQPYLEDIIHLDKKDPTERPFYNNISNQIFTNVRDLFEQIEAQFTDRAPDETVGAQIIAFCVYSCALFSTYLYKYPHICPDRTLSEAAPYMLKRTRGILVESQEAWPLASRWVDSIDRFLQVPQDATPVLEGSMTDGKNAKPAMLSQQPCQVARQRTGSQLRDERPLPPTPSKHPTPTEPSDMLSASSSSSYTYDTLGHKAHSTAQHAYLSPPNQSPHLLQNVDTARPETYVGQPCAPRGLSLLQAHHQVHQQPPSQDSPWYPRPPHPSDGLDLLINASQELQVMPPTYDIVNTWN